MDNNFNTPPSNPTPSFGGNMPFKIPGGPIAIILVVIIGIGYYVYQSVGGSNVLKNLGENIPSIVSQVNKTLKTGSTNASNSPADDAMTEKLNAYVDLLNYVSEGVTRSHDRYAQWVDEKTGPTGNERHIYGIYQLYDGESRLAAAQKAHDLQPSIDLDKHFPAYKDAYLKLKPLVDAAYTYYDQGNYKDDKMAKGKSMHAQLEAAFIAFEDASDKLSTDYELVDIAQRQKEMDQYKKDGRTFAYNTASALYLGQQMYISTRDQMSKYNQDPEKINSDALKIQVDQFETLLNNLKAGKTNTSEIKKEYGITGDSLYKLFVDSADKFLKSSKSFYRAIRDKSVPAYDNFAATTEGTPENFLAQYNEMVDAFNRLNRF